MRNFRFLTLCFALLLLTSVLAAPVADTSLEAPAADHTYAVGTLRVQQYGDHGRALILIPGLEGGSWVWRDVIAHQRGSHVIYAVTLAGFDGLPVPAGTGKLFDRADTSLLELITSRHLVKPVLVGHSLGGTLSLRFAGEHPELIGGVVALDGLPVFPGMERVSAEQRQAIAAQTRAQMAKLDPEQFRAAVLDYMQKVGTLNPDKAVRYAALNARSSAAATAEYMAEDLAGDYRPGLKRVTAPILEISPYNAADFAQPPMKMSAAQKQAYYQSLLADAPHVQVVSISPSRHFVMLDQPEKLRTALDKFLSALP